MMFMTDSFTVIVYVYHYHELHNYMSGKSLAEIEFY